MTQETISKSAYRLKIFLPWLLIIILLASITSIITFLVFTGLSTNDMRNATPNTNNETGVYNNSDSFYRELSYQATVICLLTIIALCVVFYTLKNLL